LPPKILERNQNADEIEKNNDSAKFFITFKVISQPMNIHTALFNKVINSLQEYV